MIPLKIFANYVSFKPVHIVNDYTEIPFSDLFKNVFVAWLFNSFQLCKEYCKKRNIEVVVFGFMMPYHYVVGYGFPSETFVSYRNTTLHHSS